MHNPLGFRQTPHTLRSALLRAVILGDAREIRDILPDNVNIDFSKWQGSGADGTSRAILTYLAMRTHGVQPFPHVRLYEHDFDHKLEKFWNALPDRLLDEALAELQTLQKLQRKDLEEHAVDGLLTMSRAFSNRQASAILWTLEEQGMEEKELEIPMFFLHSWTIKGDPGYELSDRYPVKLEASFPVDDVFISTYHIAEDDREARNLHVAHHDKELIMINRSPRGKLTVDPSMLKIFDGSVTDLESSEKNRRFMRGVRNEYLLSPVLTEMERNHEQILKMNRKGFAGAIEKIRSFISNF